VRRDAQACEVLNSVRHYAPQHRNELWLTDHIRPGKTMRTRAFRAFDGVTSPILPDPPLIQPTGVLTLSISISGSKKFIKRATEDSGQRRMFPEEVWSFRDMSTQP
jgi:hypothetical protein